MFANWNLFPNFNTSEGCFDLVVNLHGFGANVMVRDNLWFQAVPPVRKIVSIPNEFQITVQEY